MHVRLLFERHNMLIARKYENNVLYEKLLHIYAKVCQALLFDHAEGNFNSSFSIGQGELTKDGMDGIRHQQMNIDLSY